MAHVLSAVLNKPDHEVAKVISELEDKYGYPSHDVRLLAENIQLARQKHQELNLDPDDTTSQELYHAALARYDSDCKEIDKSLGLEANSTFKQRLAAAIKMVKESSVPQDTWALKSTAAKNLLRAHPPKKLMKTLNYRSLDSMLKREDIYSLFMLASLVESSAWRNQNSKLIAKQKTTSFERRPVYITAISDWPENSNPEKDRLVLFSQVTGSVGLLINRDLQDIATLTMALLLSEGLESLGIKISLEQLNPALKFWGDSHKLVVHKAPDSVSLNIKDVALNQLKNKNFEDRAHVKGAEALWQALMSRYGQTTNNVEQAANKLEQTLNLPETSAVAYEFAEAR